MSRGRARLTVAAIVFVAWMGCLMALAYPVLREQLTSGKKAIVVSRPQLLVANLVVVAELQDGSHKPPPRQVKLPALLPVPLLGIPGSEAWTLPGQYARLETVPGKVISVPVEVVGDGPFEEVVVKEVLWPKDRANLEGETLTVRNLRLCDKEYGWEGPGRYVLALTARRGATNPVYIVTPVPRSPGYDTPRVNEKVRLPPAPIYKETPEVRRQVEHLLQMFHKQ